MSARPVSRPLWMVEGPSAAEPEVFRSEIAGFHPCFGWHHERVPTNPLLFY
jgi:hypothetical protein